MDSFVDGYNHTHCHTGIGLNTPADMHYGLAADKALERAKTLAAARAKHPNDSPPTTTPKSLPSPTPPGSTHQSRKTTQKQQPNSR